MNIVALKYCNLLVVYKIHLHMCIFLSPGDLVGKESACSAGDPSSILGSGRSPQQREWQPTTIFLLGELHGQRSLVGHNPWGQKELDMIERLTCIQTHMHIYVSVHAYLTMLKEKKCRFNDYQIICSFLHDIFEAPSWKICSVVCCHTLHQRYAMEYSGRQVCTVQSVHVM